MVAAETAAAELEQEGGEDGASIEDAVRALVPEDWRNSREWVLGGLVAVVLRKYGPVLLARIRSSRKGA